MTGHHCPERAARASRFAAAAPVRLTDSGLRDFVERSMAKNPSGKSRVAVVGATGLAGQEFLAALAEHPSFEVTKVAASERSAGKAYGDAIRGASGQQTWLPAEPLSPRIAALTVEAADQLDAAAVDLVFTAVDTEPARELEPRYAKTTPVISTASAFRMEADVPLLLPGVNMDHLALIETTRKQRGWKGFVLPNPNCTAVGLAFALAPLHRTFGIERVHMVSLQAVSGAGRSPGVIALDIVDNVIPFIKGEEDKVPRETAKVLGTLEGGAIKPAGFPMSVTCTRVPVLEGHTEAVHVQLARKADAAAITKAWQGFGAEFVAAGYPSAPPALIHVHEGDPFRPQPRLDRNLNGGMTTVVGRLRPDPAIENGWKFVLVSHNTRMGAARGCVLMAEHLRATGLIQGG
jgi:aspartate-semialdehyde dehydrogenase